MGRRIQVRKLQNKIYSCDNDNLNIKVSNLKDFKNKTQFMIQIVEKPTEEFLKLLNEIKKYCSPRILKIEINTQDDIKEFFQILSIGIGKKLKLYNLSFSFSSQYLTVYEEAKQIAMCFSKNIQKLTIQFGGIDQISYQEILKGLKNIKDLITLDFSIQTKNNLDVKEVYKVIQHFNSLKELRLEMNSECLEIQPFNQVAHLSNCEYLQMRITEIISISSFKNAEKLKCLSLKLDSDQQRIYDLFLQTHLPHLQSVESLELIINNFYPFTIQFQQSIVNNLNGLQKLSIQQNSCSTHFELGQILSVLNNQITSFSINCQYYIILLLQESDILLLREVRHLIIGIKFSIFEDKKKFYRYFNKLDNLLTLKFDQYQYIVREWVLKAKRLVTIN